jgi:hypothetical protein
MNRSITMLALALATTAALAGCGKKEAPPAATAPAADTTAPAADATTPPADGASANTNDRPQGGGEKL